MLKVISLLRNLLRSGKEANVVVDLPNFYRYHLPSLLEEIEKTAKYKGLKIKRKRFVYDPDNPLFKRKRENLEKIARNFGYAFDPAPSGVDTRVVRTATGLFSPVVFVATGDREIIESVAGFFSRNKENVLFFCPRKGVSEHLARDLTASGYGVVLLDLPTLEEVFLSKVLKLSLEEVREGSPAKVKLPFHLIPDRVDKEIRMAVARLVLERKARLNRNGRGMWVEPARRRKGKRTRRKRLSVSP